MVYPYIKKFMNNSYKYKKILIICPYPKNVAAGQRLKYEQYIDSWEEAGYEVTISNFFDQYTYSILYQKHHYLAKLLGIFRGFLLRFQTLFILRSYDLVYIHMWVTPIGTNLFERMYRLLSKKIIYDIEDFVILKKNSFVTFREFISSKIRSRNKFFFLIKYSDHVITSAPDLNIHTKKINKFNNSTYISSSLSEKRFLPSARLGKKITLGWTGTFTTFKYFQLIEPVLKRVQDDFDIKITVIGNFKYQSKTLDMHVMQWNPESEIEDLSTFDIGLYPLNNSEWVGGKSGLKAIQYMAMGIPFVASNLGINSQLFPDGQAGFLVASDKEWYNRLAELINDSVLRRDMGINARMHFLNNYSQEHISVKYLSILSEELK